VGLANNRSVAGIGEEGIESFFMAHMHMNQQAFVFGAMGFDKALASEQVVHTCHLWHAHQVFNAALQVLGVEVGNFSIQPTQQHQTG